MSIFHAAIRPVRGNCAAREEGPVAPVALRRGGDECKLRTCYLMLEFALNYCKEVLANRLACHTLCLGRTTSNFERSLKERLTMKVNRLALFVASQH